MGTLGRVVYSLGKAARETGQALDRLGCRLQGVTGFKEDCKSHHLTLLHSASIHPFILEWNATGSPH